MFIEQLDRERRRTQAVLQAVEQVLDQRLAVGPEVAGAGDEGRDQAMQANQRCGWPGQVRPPQLRRPPASRASSSWMIRNTWLAERPAAPLARPGPLRPATAASCSGPGPPGRSGGIRPGG